ncbi:hypothetical protein TTHERM_00125670 (macronuclear) [Tetrahymena thermophila SB210]|uniref:Uncharacterized protein n=1 Tax=Tetrahymena thermophila (strain SB210) TaxID=312017 RepID=I7M1B4_TETTS|nr:hypothetical protein TTHERM_00125670 [Tetrahymena thermophila SB210]EAR96001.1 hypothetical protein TTHERM_00125670 [Tetrahymena thermophila SB210]|eukprot:XP_001016246.1 hypothetical protein TTHERM_00125670 [Tetrahymena thermophila SB210]
MGNVENQNCKGGRQNIIEDNKDNSGIEIPLTGYIMSAEFQQGFIQNLKAKQPSCFYCFNLSEFI